MKAIITGVSGFVGSHLAQLLLTKKIEVIGINHPKYSTNNLKGFADKISIVTCDLLDKKSLKEKIKNSGSVDYIFHLAAYSSPSKSFENPKETIENNLFGELNLLEILKDLNSKAKILIVGSADEYGEVNQKYLPVNESTPLNPNSPYAVSKVAQDFLGLQFYLNSKLNVIRVRPFNHIGPRQSSAFVVSSFASQIAKLEKKGGGILKVGNLDSWRDFTDVRDMCEAYYLTLSKGMVGEVYNLGSGKAYKIADILEKLISFTKIDIKVEQDQKLYRKTDVKKIICDNSKFTKQTGWKPKWTIHRTLFDTIEFERQLLK